MQEHQRQTNDALKGQQALPWGSGAANLGDVTIGAGAVLAIPHKLGRNLVGWLAHSVRPTSVSTYVGTFNMMAVVETKRDAQNLTLASQQAVTFGLLVW